jgi:hypothetical protein
MYVYIYVIYVNMYILYIYMYAEEAGAEGMDGGEDEEWVPGPTLITGARSFL